MFKYNEKTKYLSKQSKHKNFLNCCTQYLSKQQSTQTGWYTIAACFLFEPKKKCVIFKDIFRDFPGPEIFRKNLGISKTFPDYWMA